VLGFGTWQIKGKNAEDAVHEALISGYRHIDTAAIYGNEKEVGRAIRKSGIDRKDIFLATKLWNDDHEDPKSALAESLDRLGMDYVDLYLMHWPVKERIESWKIMQSMKKEGKCVSIGVSNFTITHLRELIDKTKIIPAINQVEFNPFLYQKDLLEFCHSRSIATEAYSPLAHGAVLKDPELAALAGKCRKSPAQMLIRWSLQKGLIALPKSANSQRIKENSEVFDFSISEADMKIMDGFNRNLRTCWDPTEFP